MVPRLPCSHPYPCLYLDLGVVASMIVVGIDSSAVSAYPTERSRMFDIVAGIAGAKAAGERLMSRRKLGFAAQRWRERGGGRSVGTVTRFREKREWCRIGRRGWRHWSWQRRRIGGVGREGEWKVLMSTC